MYEVIKAFTYVIAFSKDITPYNEGVTCTRYLNKQIAQMTVTKR
jgi:hypothetical protein